MWILEGLQSSNLSVTLVAGPTTIRNSGWAPIDLEQKKCKVQGGILPGNYLRI